MQHHATDRLDQLAYRGGIRGILVAGNDDQAAELVLAPILEYGRGERARETDHHDRTDLLLERHPGRAQDGVLVAATTASGRRRRRWPALDGRRWRDRGGGRHDP